jgi:hypothetical protein
MDMAYRILVEKHHDKRPLGRPRKRQENIKTDIGIWVMRM